MIGRFNPITVEFVLSHRLLKERTADNPDRVAAALDESSDLAADIVRLHEIMRAYERFQDFSPQRFIVQAHPEFSKEVEDFRDRWASAYDEARTRIYNREASRVSDEFLRCYQLMIERTGDDPAAVKSLCKQDIGLRDLISRLKGIRNAFENPVDYYGDDDVERLDRKEFLARTRELSRFVANAPRQFHDALEDFRLRWSDPHIDVEDLLDRLGEAEMPVIKSQFAPNWVRDLINSLPHMPPEEGSDETDGIRYFDPSRDSAADAIERTESSYEDAAWNHGYSGCDYPPGEAFAWMHETVGVDLHEIERRWKEFPVIIVPQHISDGYGLEEPRGLYASLTQIRLAYMIGADSAAISLCRSVTERLIRFHYAFHVPNATDSKKEKLTGENNLIEKVEQRYPELQKFNLLKKVKEANGILHTDMDKDDIKHRDRDRGLVTQWVIVLDKMIKNAPFNNNAETH